MIVTSRVQLGVLTDARVFSLDPLPPSDGIRVLAQIIGQPRVDGEREAAEKVVTACGGFPLAVRIAGARLAARPSWPVAYLTGLLADERHRLDHLVAGDFAVRASIALSYQALDPRAQRAFWLFALAGRNEIAGWVVNLLLSERSADDVLESLVDRSLLTAAGVDPLGQPRYRLHDLLYDYANELLADVPDHENARERLFGGWLELIDCADFHIPREPYLPMPARYPTKLTVGQPIRQVIARAPQSWLAAGIALRLAAYLHLRNYHEDAERMWGLVTTAAERAGDRRVAAQARLRAAVVIALDRGHHAQAITAVGSSLAAFEEQGDVRNLARTLALRAYSLQALDRSSEARHDAERGLALARAAGDPHAEFSCLRILGLTLGRLDRHQEAAHNCQAALAVARNLGEPSYEAIALCTLVQVHVGCHRYDLVPHLYEEGLKISASAGDELL